MKRLISYFFGLCIGFLSVLSGTCHAQELVFTTPDSLYVHSYNADSGHLLYQVKEEPSLVLGRLKKDSVQELGHFNFHEKISGLIPFFFRDNQIYVVVPSFKEYSNNGITTINQTVILRKENEYWPKGWSLVQLTLSGEYVRHFDYLTLSSGYFTDIKFTTHRKELILAHTMSEDAKLRIDGQDIGQSATGRFYVKVKMTNKMKIKDVEDGSQTHKTSSINDFFVHKKRLYTLQSTCCEHESDYHNTTRLVMEKSGKVYSALERNSHFAGYSNGRLLLLHSYPPRSSEFNLKQKHQIDSWKDYPFNSDKFHSVYDALRSDTLTLIYSRGNWDGRGSSKKLITISLWVLQFNIHGNRPMELVVDETFELNYPTPKNSYDDFSIENFYRNKLCLKIKGRLLFYRLHQ